MARPSYIDEEETDKMDINETREVLGKKFAMPLEDIQRVIRESNLPRNAKILDVGTGIGRMAISLALNGYRVSTGEPADDESIYANQDWLGNSKKMKVDHRIEFKPFDARSIPHEDGCFDALFCFGTFHHIDEVDRAKVFREFIRVTKSDAIICFFEPNRKRLEMIWKKDPSHPEAADPNKYVGNSESTSRKIKGDYFDAFVFQKH